MHNPQINLILHAVKDAGRWRQEGGGGGGDGVIGSSGLRWDDGGSGIQMQKPFMAADE